MSFPYHQQYMDYSNPTTPVTFPWEVEHDPTAQASGSASISPEALQQPMPLHPQAQHQHQQMPEPVEPIHQHQEHQQPTPTTVYQAPPTIHLQERVPPSQFRFDNIDESHFQQQQENPPRSSTRSSSKKPASLRVSVDQSRPSTATSLGPSRVPHGRQHGQIAHPYRHSSDGAGTRTAGSVRTQTGSRRAHDGEGSEQHHGFHERQSRLGLGSDGALVGLMPMVGTGLGTSTVSCPAVHTWRVNQSAPSPMMQMQRNVSGGSAAAMTTTTTSPEATSPMPIPTPGSAHTPTAPMNTPTATMPPLPGPPPNVQQPQAMPMPPPVYHHQPVAPLKRYNIRTDVHYDAAVNQLTAMFELPGLKKSDLKISMSVCPYSRVRQVTISGRSYPKLPESGYTVKERKFGAFSRTVVVPPETKPADIEAIMEDGILILRVPGGVPAELESLQEIAIV